MMNDRLRRAITFLILLLPLLILLPGFSRFVYPAGSDYSDLTISHYPNLIFLQDSLKSGAGVPLWSDTILSGYPFAANPLAGIWFPFTWILVWLPQPFGFNLLILLHLLAGGFGVYLLVRDLGKGYWPAIISALSFELMPKLLAHYAAGHITMVFAVCVTPWLILVENLRDKQKNVVWRVLPGLLLGWIALADIRWVPYAGIVWLLFFIRRRLASFRAIIFKQKTRLSKLSSRALYSAAGDFCLQFVVALGISAPLLMPMLQYTSLSTRNNLLTGDRLAFSLLPARLLGLLYPDLGGYCEWVIYPGIFSLFALIIVLSSKSLRRENWIWFGILAGSIFISLGANNPVMPFIARLPGYELLRVPTRAMFLGGLAFSMLAGSVSEFFSTEKNTQHIKIWPIFAVMVFSCSFFIAYSMAVREFSFDFLWGAVGSLAIFLLVVAQKHRGSKFTLLLTVFLPVFVVLDLGGVNFSGFQFRSLDAVLQQDSRTVDWLIEDSKKPFRVYSPSYSISQLAASLDRLELADGIDPLQLKAYVDYMSEATGVKYETYGVTVPPFGSGDPRSDNIGSLPDANLLGVLNVRYLVSAFPVDQAGFVLRERLDGKWIYENVYARPRAWMQRSGLDLQQSYQPLEILNYTPGRIELVAESPGLVVLSEIAYPGWKVYVDGTETPMIVVDGLLRGVQIAQEKAHIQFLYRPMLVYVGLGATGITLLFIIFLWIFERQKGEINEYADKTV